MTHPLVRLTMTGVLMVGALSPSPVSATPPDRPVAIQLVAEDELPRMKGTEQAFNVVVKVRAQPDIKGVRIYTEVMRTEALVPRVIAKEEQRYKLDTVEQLEVRVPRVKEKGIHKVEIAAGDLNGAIFDRVMLYQVVDDQGARLLTQKQWRGDRAKQRGQMFRKSRSVRRLSGHLRTVSKQDLEGVNVAAGDRRFVLVRADGNPGSDASHVQDHSQRAWSDRDPITVRGRIVYTDFEGTVRPLINAGIYLYDEDTFGDDFLGSTATDWNGEYSFSVNNDDGWLQNGRDIYIKLKLRNTRWRVHDGDDYEWASDVREDLSEGSVVDFGTLTPEDDQEAAQVFAVINRGWNHISTVGSRDPGFVDVLYPGSGDFFDGQVNISAASNRAPDIVIHEYGHFLMESAYPAGNVSPGGGHGFNDTTQDARLAWSEGWATGFMLSVCNDGQYNWDEGTTEDPGEWPTCTTQNDAGGRQIERYSNSTNRIGEQQEGRVAAAILDFIDAANDDNGGTEDRGRNDRSDDNTPSRVSLSTIYNEVMWGSGHNNFLEFWRSLAGEVTGTLLSGASRIMQYNWMSEPISIELDCVASKIAVADSPDYGRLLNGLRAFRDEGLKPLEDGRRLMQLYYRHSPELAMLLLKDGEARKDAMQIVMHFSMIGEAARNHQKLKQLSAANQLFVPPAIASGAKRIFALIDREGSKELQGDATRVYRELDRFGSLTLSEAMELASQRKKAQANDPSMTVRQHELAPASRKADWDLIRKHLPDYREDSRLPDTKRK